MRAVKRLWSRVEATPAWRGWQRYNDARGNLLAGGVTYFAFLSIFPALALAFTIFGVLLKDHPDWLGDIRDYLDTTLPGFIKDANGEGLIPLSIPGATTLSITGALAVLGLLFAGLGWLSATRDGIRTIFGAKGGPGNILTDKLRDLVVMLLFGVGIVVSAFVTVVAGAVAGATADAVGLGGQGWLLTLAGLVVGVVLDGMLVALMLRALSGVDVPWRGLRTGAIVGGVGLTLLKVVGSRLLAHTMGNKLYGSIALVVGLLVWLNLISRVVLLSAALAANNLDARLADLPVSDAVKAKATEGPDELAESMPAGSPTALAAARTSQGLPTFSTRAADRTALVAGAALGATTLAVVGASVRGALRLVRPRR